MRTQVINTVRACFAAVRQIRSMRRSLSQHALLTLIFGSLVITKLDQCNSVLVGTSVYLQDRLQSVLNAPRWLVYSRQTSEHNPTATGASLVMRPGTNPVPVVCRDSRDSGLLLTFDIPEGDQVSPFCQSKWLTWRWSADIYLH